MVQTSSSKQLGLGSFLFCFVCYTAFDGMKYQIIQTVGHAYSFLFRESHIDLPETSVLVRCCMLVVTSWRKIFAYKKRV